MTAVDFVLLTAFAAVITLIWISPRFADEQHRIDTHIARMLADIDREREQDK